MKTTNKATETTTVTELRKPDSCSPERWESTREEREDYLARLVEAMQDPSGDWARARALVRAPESAAASCVTRDDVVAVMGARLRLGPIVG